MTGPLDRYTVRIENFVSLDANGAETDRRVGETAATTVRFTDSALHRDSPDIRLV